MKSTIQKVFWAENIKFLRNRKKLSQEALAEALQIGRPKLNAHEHGKTVNPPVEDLFRMSDYFRISIDSLLKIDLSKLGEFKLRELETGNDVYMTGSKIRVLAITVDKDNRENVEYVPVKAKAGYRSGYHDPEFIATLPKYSFPDLPSNGSYRMFPSTGDSMLPMPEGCDLLTRYVQDWKSLKPGTPCVVILGDQDFVFKKVTIQSDGRLLLESMNELYQPYVEDISNVFELWQFDRFMSKTIPEKATGLQELKDMMLRLREEVKNLSGNI